MTRTTPTTTMEPAAVPGGTERLRLVGVDKTFGPVRALSDVTFEVATGEIHGLIGENGAGKSTLMAVAAGALSPETGTVTIDGTSVLGDPVLSRSLGLAIVRQNPALLPELTVADNLLLGFPAGKRPKIADAVVWARECLAAWDDENDIDPEARVSTLNPEQRFVIEISRALYQRPGVLILDEPSEHLGADDVQRLFTAVRALAAEGSAIVYISHRIHEVQEISDRVTILRDGVIRGTRYTHELDETEIVRLIIGRSLDATFPDRVSYPAPATGTPKLSVTDLSGPGFTAIGFDIQPGEIVGIAGIDDNGQADLARALAGLVPSTGTVELDGAAVRLRSSTEAARAGIAYVPADRHKEGVFEQLTVRENAMLRGIRTVSRLGFVSSRREMQSTRAVLAKYAVKTASTEAAISTLSGGNQQKVVIGGALLNDPRLVIADQPTQGVDVGAKSDIYTHLREIAANGGAVLMLSSNNTELAGVCDRVLVMSRGRIVSSIPGAALSEESITDAVLRAGTTREHATSKRSRWARLVDHDLAPVPVLAAVVIGLAVFTQFQNANYISDRNLSTVLTFAAILALVSVGQSIPILRGGFDLSVGALMSSVVVIASYYMVDDAGAGYHVMGWGLIFGLCVGVGIFNWALIDRLRIHPMLATFGTWMLLEALNLTLRPTPGGLISGSIVVGIAQKFGIIPLVLIIAVLLIAGAEYWRTRTLSGKQVRAVGSDAHVAELLGISESRSSLVAYLLCSLFAGAAGVLLIGQVGSGDATAGAAYTLQSVAAAVVGGLLLTGGRGSFIGVLFAAVLLTQVRSVTTFLTLSDAWQNLLLAFVTIGAVFIYSIARRRARPRGDAS